MKASKDSMLLYVVTDRTWLGDNSLVNQVEETLKAGATFVQLREKTLPYDAFVREAVAMKRITDRYNIPFVINDNVDVALSSGADGVHVGQSDLNARTVRERIGDGKILGVSVTSVEQAIWAQDCGADYLGVGAMFSTSTKLDADTVTMQTLAQICKAVSLPVVAIGGINEQNLLQLKGTGVDGVAVISAIFAQKDIYQAAANLRCLSSEMVAP